MNYLLHSAFFHALDFIYLFQLTCGGHGKEVVVMVSRTQ